MAQFLFLFLASFLTVFSLQTSGETCLSPHVISEVYTTTEMQMSSETVVLVEFTLQCKNGVKDLNLYAEFNGKTLPASRVVDSDRYQVSFSDEHKKLPGGRYQVRFFDEDLYSDLRKAQRSGDDTTAVKNMFTVEVNHQGASRGQLIQTEHVAASAAILVWWLAYTARNRLQS